MQFRAIISINFYILLKVKVNLNMDQEEIGLLGQHIVSVSKKFDTLRGYL